MGRFSDLRQHATRPSRIAFIPGLFSHLRKLSPGDKLVVLILGFVFTILAVLGLYNLEKQFLVEVPSRGGSLTEGAVGAPRFANPLLAISDADRDLAVLTYAGLMGYGAEGMLVPVVAEGYEVSEDGKTYTFKIRSTARFSDGTPLTADDVVFTVHKAQDPSLKSPELANWSNILVEAVDARTVRFTLPKAYAPFLEDATLGILPERLWRDVSDEEFAFSPLMSNPVGAGPFRVSHIERDKNGVAKRYDLAASNVYALGRPYLDKISFVYFADQAELEEAVARGRVESGADVPSARALEAPYSRIFGVFFNPGSNALFARLEVRKALSIAINREALVQNTLGGYGTPVDGPVPPGSGAPIALPITPADPTASAASVLTAAGWEQDETTHAWTLPKEKLELTVTLKTANVPELKAIADAVKVDWEKLGVTVETELYEPSELASSVIRPRKYDALLFGMVVGRDRDLFAFWDSSQRTDPGLNIAMYASRAADTLLEKIRSERDSGALAGELAELDTLIAADYPAAFTHAPDFFYTVPKDLQGVMLTQVATPTDRLASVAFWYKHTAWVWPALVKTRQ